MTIEETIKSHQDDFDANYNKYRMDLAKNEAEEMLPEFSANEKINIIKNYLTEVHRINDNLLWDIKNEMGDLKYEVCQQKKTIDEHKKINNICLITMGVLGYLLMMVIMHLVFKDDRPYMIYQPMPYLSSNIDTSSPLDDLDRQRIERQKKEELIEEKEKERK